MPDVWVPLAMQATLMPDAQPRDFFAADNLSWLSVLGRLKPGMTASQAQADLAVLAAQMDHRFPGRTTEVQVTQASFLGNPKARKVMLIAGSIILLAVALVLLVACANVANLLLARAATRQREIAIRLSIGVSRGRLIRQLLTESALISIMGGALGLLLARWSLQVGYAVAVPRVSIPPVSLRLDLNILLYTVLLSVAGTLMFGLAPALHATRPDLSGALKDEGALWGRRLSRTRLRSVLVAGQMAICMMLLLATGLLIHGLINAQVLNTDLQLKDVHQIGLHLREQGYDDARAASFYQQLMDKLAS